MLWNFHGFREEKTVTVWNVAINFVSSVDLVPWCISVVGGQQASLSAVIARCTARICFRFDHWNYEPKCGSVNFHVVHLNITKNNNISVLCWVVLFAVSRECVNSPNLQGGARNVIPFYQHIKIVTSQYRCCKRASECCSSWEMR